MSGKNVDYIDVENFSPKELSTLLNSLEGVNKLLGDSEGVIHFPGAPEKYTEADLIALKKEKESR